MISLILVDTSLWDRAGWGLITALWLHVLSDLYCLTVSVGELGPGSGLLFGHKEELWLYWDAGSSEGGLRKLPGWERVKGKSGFVYNTEEWDWQSLGVSDGMWEIKYRVFCSVLICRCSCPSLPLLTSCTGACMGLEGRGVWGGDREAHRQMQEENIPETTRSWDWGWGSVFCSYQCIKLYVNALVYLNFTSQLSPACWDGSS